jgi:predicted site-specific integrase-resolvase
VPSARIGHLIQTVSPGLHQADRRQQKKARSGAKEDPFVPAQCPSRSKRKALDFWNAGTAWNGERAMLVGYARTSTVEQAAGLEAQLRDLRALGCDKVFHEQTSSVGPRKALEHALEFVREGDTLVVTRLDRLARSVVHLGQIVDRLQARHVFACSMVEH